MSADSLPAPLPAAVVRAQHEGVAAWRDELGRRLAASPLGELSWEERGTVSAWLRTRTAVDACLARQARGTTAAPAVGPRGVVVHRSPAFRAELETELTARGLQLIARGKDGAVAVALAVVEQPELLVVEDCLPGVPPLELIASVRRFAPGVLLVVCAHEDSDIPGLLDAGASFVVEPQATPGEVGEQCAAQLVGAELSPALLGDAAVG